MPRLLHKIKGWNRKQVMLVLGCVVLIQLLIVALVLAHTYVTDGLPRKAYANLSFPAYFPNNPPQGFTFNRSSVSSTPNVLTYGYTYHGTMPILVSIQPADPQLDTTSFKPTREINTPIGHGYLATFETRTTVAIITDKSFVLINSPQGIPDYVVEQFADSLSAIK